MAGDIFPGCRAAAMLAILAVAGVEIAARSLPYPAPSALLLLSFAATPGWSAFALVAMMASWRERIGLLAALLAAIAGSAAAAWPCSIGLGFGMAPYAVLVWGMATRTGAARRRALDLLAASLIVQVSALAMPFFLAITVPALPGICDATLVRLDASFGLQPSGVAALLLRHNQALGLLCKVVYGFLPVGVTAVAAVQATGPCRPRLGLLPAFLVAALLGYGAYYVLPAIGPRAFFGSGFPVLHPNLAAAARHLADSDPAHVRNAMPSLHAAWAVLMLLATRGQARAIRAAAAAFLALTALATLGLGEHYAIDLVLALPLVLAVRALCAVEIPWTDGARLVALGLGAGSLAGWAVLIRSGAVLPAPVGLLAMAATVASAIWAERALSRAPARRVRPPARRVACRTRLANG